MKLERVHAVGVIDACKQTLMALCHPIVCTEPDGNSRVKIKIEK